MPKSLWINGGITPKKGELQLGEASGNPQNFLGIFNCNCWVGGTPPMLHFDIFEGTALECNTTVMLPMTTPRQWQIKQILCIINFTDNETETGRLVGSLLLRSLLSLSVLTMNPKGKDPDPDSRCRCRC